MTGEVIIQVVSIGPHTEECGVCGCEGVKSGCGVCGCEGWRVDVECVDMRGREWMWSVWV